jgi:DNA methylase
MFPLQFPLAVLNKYSQRGQSVCDPFCGRGTTSFAARVAGRRSIAIDSNPVAVAISEAKLVSVKPAEIMTAYDEIVSSALPISDPPSGEFWELAFAPSVLEKIGHLRDGLILDSSSPARKALRAILLGALHGPVGKQTKSYLSNQSPRTYAPKPAYAVLFWKARGLTPPMVDIRAIVSTRANRYYGGRLARPRIPSRVVLGDSRVLETVHEAVGGRRVHWFITSPPYYGLRTYGPDQWLRGWFVGGPPDVSYSNAGQLEHRSPEVFADELHDVWVNLEAIAADEARLVVRFGAINDRTADPLEILRDSFSGTAWRMLTRKAAGSASNGRRQATSFARRITEPMKEMDVWMSLS